MVATHSSHILRGIIQTGQDIQIVHLTRRDNSFSAYLVAAEILAEAMAKPTVRAESILDGIFAQCVIVVEADGDRLVYQTTFETLSAELPLTIHFATVSGTGGIADTCKLYRTLNIPVAVIADRDAISDPTRLGTILKVMVSPKRGAELVQRAREIVAAIKKLPPTLTPRAAEERLKALLSKEPISEPSSEVWNDESDVLLRRELNKLSKELDRMREIKHGAVQSLPEPIRKQLHDLLEALSECGVFLVPVGELEDWFEIAEIGESRKNKWAWANAAALHIQATGARDGAVWEFMRRVCDYLSHKLRAHEH